MVQLFIPNSTDPAPASCYCWRCPPKAPREQKVPHWAKGISAELLPSSARLRLCFPNCPIPPPSPFPAGFRGVQDQATSVPAVHSLKEVRECRVTTKILFLDPNSGVLWAQSGSSALLPLFYHLLPTFTPHLIFYFTLGLPARLIPIWKNTNFELSAGLGCIQRV